MITKPHFIEIIFWNHLAPGDLEIVVEATYDQPGQVRLGQARVTDPPEPATSGHRVLSHNGGDLIGVIAPAEFMAPPYNFSYWLLPVAVAETKEISSVH